MKYFKLSFFLLGIFSLTACIPNMSPNGNSSPDYPYYITTEPLIIKKIVVPKGTKLIYEKSFFKKGEQTAIMNPEELTTIELQNGATINWGGIPVIRINKFFNPEMRGFSVTADFNKLKNEKRTPFSDLWQSCQSDLGVLVKDIDDWSFNKKNISDVNDCSVNYQRYFKEDKEQQVFLDNTYSELLKISSK